MLVRLISVRWIASGDLHVCVDRVFRLDEASEGHVYLESGQSKGKVLFEI
jgi:NADPH:quinone reductase-like Zn-dependent oxidoreductase